MTREYYGSSIGSLSLGVDNSSNVGVDEIGARYKHRYSSIGVGEFCGWNNNNNNNNKSESENGNDSRRNSAEKQRQRGQHRSFSDNASVKEEAATRVKKEEDKNRPLVNPNPDVLSFGVNATDVMTGAGGPFAQSTAKRDKLGELRVELEDRTKSLDTVATPLETLDLELVDGLMLVAKSSDEGCRVTQAMLSRNEVEDEVLPSLRGFHDWLDIVDNDDEMLDEAAFAKYLEDASHFLTSFATVPPVTQFSPSPLASLRDFYTNSVDTNDDTNDATNDDTMEQPQTTEAFDQCTLLFRATLAKSATAFLSTQWKQLTTTTDSDLDRAAVEGNDLSPRTSIPKHKLKRVLHSYAFGSCQDRLKALWDLFDYDDDGLIDELEMQQVVHIALEPVHLAIRTFVEQALDAHPVRVLPQQPSSSPSPTSPPSDEDPPKLGFGQRRLEKKTKKKLLKLLTKTISNAFEVEMQLPHRLRCVYHWAEKSHQNNSIDRALVKSQDGVIDGGRQRYVELNPKISFREFALEQQDHFPHLNRMGQELLFAYKEDLWVDQGKLRHNKKERREVLAFLAAVCLIDYGITCF